MYINCIKFENFCINYNYGIYRIYDIAINILNDLYVFKFVGLFKGVIQIDVE